MLNELMVCVHPIITQLFAANERCQPVLQIVLDTLYQTVIQSSCLKCLKTTNHHIKLALGNKHRIETSSDMQSTSQPRLHKAAFLLC